MRTFLAEWNISKGREANWEPVVPTELVRFIADFEFRNGERILETLTWICHRELQRKVADISKDENNFPGNAALITLYILGFSLLSWKN